MTWLILGIGVALIVGCNVFWRWYNAKQWRPADGLDAVHYICSALGIQPPAVTWIRSTSAVDVWGRKIGGMWVPGRLTICKGDGEPYSATALPLELARETRMQLEHVRDDSEPPHLTITLEGLRQRIGELCVEFDAKGAQHE